MARSVPGDKRVQFEGQRRPRQSFSRENSRSPERLEGQGPFSGPLHLRPVEAGHMPARDRGPYAEIPFDNILDRLTGSNPSVTDYVLEAPARCLRCGARLTCKPSAETLLHLAVRLSCAR